MKVLGVYVGEAGRRNFEVGVSSGTWGWEKHWNEPSELAPGDLIVISQGGGGRLKLEEWTKRTASSVVLGRITRSQYRSDEALWPDEKTGDRHYPNRVDFEPIARAEGVPFQTLPLSVSRAMQVSATKSGRGFPANLSVSEEGQLRAALEDSPHREGPYQPARAYLSPAPTNEPVSHQPFDLDWLVRATLRTEAFLTEIIQTVTTRRPQVVLAGPPGTGKTWLAKQLASYLTAGRPGAVHTVQFHPSYSYEDFVTGLRPVASDNGIEFAQVEGPLVTAAEHARGADHPVVLIIDEMNRANIPRVFGELMYLLEYREEPITLMHRRGFSLPKNLLIIATMNTADRSIRSIDTALRRRFDVFECPPEPAALNRYYGSGRSCEVDDLDTGLSELNRTLAEDLDRHHLIGHTFLMADHFDSLELHRTWERQVLPLIEEYYFDQPDRVEEYSIRRFWPKAE